MKPCSCHGVWAYLPVSPLAMRNRLVETGLTPAELAVKIGCSLETVLDKLSGLPGKPWYENALMRFMEHHGLSREEAEEIVNG